MKDAQFFDEKKICTNIENFVSNLALMNKDLSSRSKNVIKTIKKVAQVGYINKYF